MNPDPDEKSKLEGLLSGFAHGVSKIVSGGQTGADQAGLEWALAKGIPIGGWCPKGRKTEDGVIPDCYSLQETPTGNYVQRTEWNVRDSDATVIFTIRSELNGGSYRTWEFAQKYGKPVIHLSRNRDHDAVAKLQEFLKPEYQVLNIAGSRASKEPEVGQWVKEVLEEAIQ